MRFEFATATQIVFGSGILETTVPTLMAMGNRPLVIVGNNEDRACILLDMLVRTGMTAEIFRVASEPTIATVCDGRDHAQAAGCDMVIGIGGGSVLDAGKAIAALMTNGGDPLDYLEVIGKGQPITQRPAPYVAVPTTAGTGSEVTRNAVLLSPEHQVKVSLRSPLMLPQMAVVDPALTLSMPPAVTASTGLDALTQVMEPYVTHKANPLTDAICREGIQRASRSLRRVYDQPDDMAAREDMALASLFGGLALANAKLGAVHGFAGPIGGMFAAPHGVVCARLLPFAMSVNVRVLEEREPDNPSLARYTDIARLVTGNPNASVADGVSWVQDLCNALSVPGLSDYGMTQADIAVVADKAARASSMQGNPQTIT
jgi:alcohol dehydrogenase class IV